MMLRTIKFLLYLSLCFSLVNCQNSTSAPTTSTTSSTTSSSQRNSTSLPTSTTEEPEVEPSAADIERYNLNVGAANVDYGPYAYHRKYIPFSTDHHFSYDQNHPRGPSRWSERWPMCAGPLQSPINIAADQCRPQTSDTRLQYFNSRRQPTNVSIENNGYSIEYLFHFESTPVLYGGPLTEGYVFEFIHFHWALEDGDGSEHQLDGAKYDLEMHLGHRNAKYRDMGEAGQNQDGIVVLAFLFQVSDAAPDNPRMAELDRVQSVNSSVQLQNPTGYTLQSFVGSLAEEIVNVRGSLTTPPCSPANWLVATQVREVSRNDIGRLRSARRNGDPIAPNNRPLQQRQNLECNTYG